MKQPRQSQPETTDIVELLRLLSVESNPKVHMALSIQMEGQLRTDGFGVMPVAIHTCDTL